MNDAMKNLFISIFQVSVAIQKMKKRKTLRQQKSAHHVKGKLTAVESSMGKILKNIIEATCVLVLMFETSVVR